MNVSIMTNYDYHEVHDYVKALPWLPWIADRWSCSWPWCRRKSRQKCTALTALGTLVLADVPKQRPRDNCQHETWNLQVLYLDHWTFTSLSFPFRKQWEYLGWILWKRFSWFLQVKHKDRFEEEFGADVDDSLVAWPLAKHCTSMIAVNIFLHYENRMRQVEHVHLIPNVHECERRICPLNHPFGPPSQEFTQEWSRHLKLKKTSKCLSIKNLSDWSKKLQHRSYRICSRIGHGPFLKESCRVLSYKSKIDLTGAHCRWILKMKVNSTFFHRFSAFSNICCYQFLFVLAPFWIFHSESTCRWSPRRPNLKIISTSSEASNFSYFCRPRGHWPCANSIVGSYWIVLDHAEDKWHSVGSLASENRLLPYYRITSFLHFCMLQSFLLGAISKSSFSVGSFRNPSNTCVGQDVKGEPTYTNHPGPAPDPRFKRNQMDSNGCLQSKDLPMFRWYFQAGKRVPVCLRKQRWSISLWFDVVEEGRLNHFNDKISPVLKVTFCQWIGLNLISSCVTCFENRAVLCLPSRPWDFMRLSTKPISLFVIASPSTIKVFPMISEEICRSLCWDHQPQMSRGNQSMCPKRFDLTMK